MRVRVTVIEREMEKKQTKMKKKSYVVNLNMSRKEVWVCHWHMKVTGIRLNAYEV